MPRGNIDSRVEVIPANGVLNLSNANFIFLQSASIAVALKFVQSSLGSSENFGNVIAGLQISRVKAWAYCNITGTPGTVVNFWYGYTDVREDNTIFSQQIAVIAGVTAVAVSPASTLTDTAAKTVVTGQAALIAENLARRRVTIFSDPGNVNNAVVYLRKSGGANNIGFLVPGTFIEFDGTYGLDTSAAGAPGDVFYIFEET